MVQELDFEEFSSFFYFPCQLDIGLTGCLVAGGVVVGEDDAGGSRLESGDED